MSLFRLSSFLTAIAIGLNALGYHSLTQLLTSSQLSIFKTGSRYLLLARIIHKTKHSHPIVA